MNRKVWATIQRAILEYIELMEDSVLNETKEERHENLIERRRLTVFLIWLKFNYMGIKLNPIIRKWTFDTDNGPHGGVDWERFLKEAQGYS